MNHQQAKAIVDSFTQLTQPEKLVVRGISDLETGYGNWGSDPLRGAGSNNMGAITDSHYIQGDPPSQTQFLHTDTRPWTPADGGVIPPDGQIHYSTAFKKYATPTLGFADVANLALKPNVKAAIASGSLRAVSAAMRANRYYFGVHPTKSERLAGMTTEQGVQANINAHAKRLIECISDATSATGEENPFLTLSQEPELKAGPPLASGSPLLASGESSSISRPTLRFGSVGPFVGEWQRLLKVKVDNDFGPQMRKLTREWQAEHDLTDDGVVGPASWNKAING